MNELRRQTKELKKHWGNVYQNALSNQAAWKPHLPNASIEMLNEAVGTIEILLDRERAPSGFSPGYHIGKTMAGVFLPQLITTTQNLEAGQYNHFPSFINSLTNLISAIHTMAIFSEKEASEKINADISAELAQSLSLLSTAQTELASKKKLLESVAGLSEEIKEQHSEVSRLKDECNENSETISDILESATNAVRETEELLQTAQSHDEEFQELLNDNKVLNDNLKQMAERLSELQDRCIAQEKIIDSILPRGASAGLAAAFSQRGRQLELGKWIWMGVFVLSLVGLSGFAWHLIAVQPEETKDFWAHVLARLPLAAPLIWLGWFSAIQYGNTIRVQEDYAFKEATSKAFQGYRDHMEHLAKIEVEGANTALNLLSAKTIEILGHEPLRVFGKTESDATPTGGIANILSNRKKGRDEGNP